jgi:hypothetical protein
MSDGRGLPYRAFGRGNEFFRTVKAANIALLIHPWTTNFAF